MSFFSLKYFAVLRKLIQNHIDSVAVVFWPLDTTEVEKDQTFRETVNEMEAWLLAASNGH